MQSFASTSRLSPKSRKSTMVGVSLLTASALALAACSGSPEPSSNGGNSDEQVTLTLWDTDARTARTERIEHLIDLFEAENPNIKIEYLGLPTDSYMEKIEVAKTMDSLPDILTPKASDISALVVQDVLADIEDRMIADGYMESMSGSMVTSVREASPDGGFYFTPSTALTDVIWYRSDLFEAAGLGTPETWDDFFNAAEVLTDRSSGQFGYTIRGGAGFWPQFVGTVLPIAGEDKYFDESGQSVFTKPSVVQATEDYVGLYNRTTAQSDLTADFKVMVAQFGAGAAAMLSHSIGSYPDHVNALGAENVMAAVAFPSKENGKRIQSSLVLGFAMTATTEHPDETWKFLQFMMDAEGNSYWAKESGYIPGNLDVANEDWVQGSQPIAISQEVMEHEDTLPLVHPYHLPTFSAITSVKLEPEWQKCLQGTISVEEFLNIVADAFDEAQAEFEASNS